MSVMHYDGVNYAVYTCFSQQLICANRLDFS